MCRTELNRGYLASRIKLFVNSLVGGFEVHNFLSSDFLDLNGSKGLKSRMDGFDQTVNVKVIMATNRADTLDPALLRPGRLDRNIEFPLPDQRQKRLFFQVCTAKMNLSEEVDLEDYVSRPDKISAAENSRDFEKGYRSNVKKSDTDFEFYR
ncbi:unnamed protein product [Sphagnum troendelagicum]